MADRFEELTFGRAGQRGGRRSARRALPLVACLAASACGTGAGAVSDLSAPDSGVSADAGGALTDGGEGADGGPDAGAVSAGPDAGTFFDAGDAGDAGGATDAGSQVASDGGVIAIPSQAPYDTWTWIDTPGAVCGDGSPTGLGLNPHAGATKLLIFLVGGGMCDDYASCFVAKSASNLGGYSKAEFLSAVTTTLNGKPGVLRRDPTNPFQDYNLAVLPYCTGDLFAGTQVVNYQDPLGGSHPLHQVGHDNILAYLAQLVPTFASTATQVVLTGSSAGGFGAVLNYQLVKGAFPGSELILIDDSGPVLRAPYLTNALMTKLWNTWGLSASMTSACQCTPNVQGFYNVYNWVAQDPNLRGSLISSEQDHVIKDFLTLGNPLMQLGSYFQLGLNDLHTSVLQPAGPGQFRVFFIQSDAHVWLEGLPYVGTLDGGHLASLDQVVTAGVSLESFLSAQVTHDGGWQDVVP